MEVEREGEAHPGAARYDEARLMIYKAYRWTRFFDVSETVTCPSGHPISIKASWGADDLVCEHRGHDGKRDCGRMIYLHPIFRFRGTPLFWACEISDAEMREMEKMKSPAEILGFLDLYNTRNAA